MHYKKMMNRLFFEGNLKDVMIAYSAGLDSTALLHMCSRYKKMRPEINFTAVFFLHNNENLVKEENLLLDFCKKQCELQNIKLTVESLDLMPYKEAGQSWESAGHLARKNFFKNCSFDIVLTGHHLDDQIETIFSQLFRGAGRAVQGMKELQGKVYRTMMPFTKEEIKSYNVESKLEWNEDITNLDTNFTRNFWRHKALPTISEYYPDYRKRILMFAQKQKRSAVLSRDLAELDGLSVLLDNGSVDISNLSEERIENLVEVYFNNKDASASFNKLQEFVKQIKSEKILNDKLTFGDVSLTFEKAENSVYLSTNLCLDKRIKFKK